MNAVIGCLYLALTALAALGVAVKDSDAARSHYGAACRLVVAGVVFFVPFFVVGLFELWLGWPKVSMASALAVQAAMMVAFLPLRDSDWRPSWPRSSHAEAAASRPLGDPRLAGAVAAVFVFCVATLTLGYPRGYEVTAYHLPTAVTFFQNGSLRPWDHAFMHTFPANMSLYAGFLLQFVPERLVSISNVLFLALTVFVVFALGRTLGATSKSSWMAAFGITTIPLIAFSALELGADVAGMACLGLAYLVALAAPDHARRWPLVAGLAAGLATGFKSLHLVGSVVLGLLVLIKPPSTSEERKWTAAASLRAVLLYAAGFVLTGGIWLARNWMEFGNPLYPVHLGALFDVLGWPKAVDVDYLQRTDLQFEFVRTPWEWLVYPWVEWHYIDQNFKQGAGLGAFFAAVVPVALAVTAIRLVGHLANRRGAKSRPSPFAAAALLLGSLAIVLVWWALDDRQPRYFMGALILAVPLVAVVLDRLAPSARKSASAVVSISIYLMLFVVLSMQAVDFGSRFIVSRQLTRADFYEYPRAVDELPPGSTVLNLHDRIESYGLMGRGLANRVLTRTSAFDFDPEKYELGMPPAIDVIGVDVLADLEIGYVFDYVAPRERFSGCLAFEEIDRHDTNPINQVPVPIPKILYRVSLCDAPPGSRTLR